jgi:hypothetical protein
LQSGRSSSGSSKRIVDSTTVVERWTVDPWLAPVTMNEITRNDGAHADSGGHATAPVSPAEFQGVRTKSLEHVYLITAEAVSAAEQPSAYLCYMNTHGDQILGQGCSTNWNLSVLKFRLLEGARGRARG